MSLSKMDKQLNAIIIDDERMARQELLRLLKKHPNVNIVAQAENIDQGYDEIEQHQPDIIFLDIEMPGGTGNSKAKFLLFFVQLMTSLPLTLLRLMPLTI